MQGTNLSDFEHNVHQTRRLRNVREALLKDIVFLDEGDRIAVKTFSDGDNRVGCWFELSQEFSDELRPKLRQLAETELADVEAKLKALGFVIGDLETEIAAVKERVKKSRLNDGSASVVGASPAGTTEEKPAAAA